MFNFGLHQITSIVIALGLVPRVELAERIDAHPQSQRVVEGQRVRFRCTVRNLPLNDTVQWTIDGKTYGPWTEEYSVDFRPPSVSHAFSYSYPKDCNPSLDEYDLDVDAVYWEDHSGSRFLCQLPDSQSREKSRAAILTVLVPPRSLTITPIPEEEIVYIPYTDSAANISCATRFVTPGSRIEWTVDGRHIPGEVHLQTKSKKNGEKLEQLSSVIRLFVQSNSSNHSPAGKQYYSGSRVKEMLEHRVNVNGYYRAAYQVICQVSNPTLEGQVLAESFWVVFQGESAAVMTSSNQSVGGTTWILIATGISVLLAIIAVVVGCFVLRSRNRTGADAYAPILECAATDIEDQGVCSSAGLDMLSDGEGMWIPSPASVSSGQNFALPNEAPGSLVVHQDLL